MAKSALLVLEDGIQFHGQIIGATGSAAGEAVFDTSMIGYQEILIDPSYSRQIITLTYPHIGSVGTNSADKESSQIHAQGLVTRDLPLITSSLRNIEDLSSCLKRHNIMAIADIDTRKLTRLLREKGAQSGCIIAGGNPDAVLTSKKARAFPGLNGMDLAKEVTTAKPYNWTQGSWTLADGLPEAEKGDEPPYHVVTYDFGARRNILYMLVDGGCYLIIVPAQASVEDVLKMSPSGISLSSGPSDPAPCDYAITAIQKFLETDILVFGICLDYQLLVLASGAGTVKVESGYHSDNHPVKDVEKNVAMVTAQNHGFVMDEATSPVDLHVIYKSLFDGTLQDVHCIDKPAFSFQGHSETDPGPYDATSLFNHFIMLIEQYREITK